MQFLLRQYAGYKECYAISANILKLISRTSKTQPNAPPQTPIVFTITAILGHVMKKMYDKKLLMQSAESPK
jgi:hypothetical protein